MSSDQPPKRRSARIATMIQASVIPPWSSLPQLALSAIHDILLHEGRDEEGFCAQPHTQRAAAFRCTCRAFCSAAVMPPTLKLAFSEPPKQQSVASLALMLSRPAASRTQLSLQLNNQCHEPAEQQQGELERQWVLPLAALAQRVERLEMDSLCINATLAAACKALPAMQHLMLHVSNASEVDTSWVDSFNLNDGEGSERLPAWLCQSQLRSLTLSALHGEPPFNFDKWEDEEEESHQCLDLRGLPLFNHLVLRGPIVRGFVEDDEPFFAPPHAQVIIDPAVDGTPTKWARPLSVFRFDAMPKTAIPDYLEYKEEDEECYRDNLAEFRAMVYEAALKRSPWLAPYSSFLSEYVDYQLSDDTLEECMNTEGILGQTWMLPVFFSVASIANSMLDDDDFENAFQTWYSLVAT